MKNQNYCYSFDGENFIDFDEEVKSETRAIKSNYCPNCGATPKEIADTWGRGYVREIKPLQFGNDGLVGIARYFVKAPIWGKRWCASKNLKAPVEETNDYRISAKCAKALFANGKDRTEYERLYPGYNLSDVKQFYNDIDGGYYLSITFYEPQKTEKRRKTK